MKKLNIQDLSKLKITTVKSWAVNFTYDGEQYFLHEDSDEDRGIGLYHKLNGRKSECIKGIVILATPMDYIKLRCGKWKYIGDTKYNIVYSQIDKEYFVKKLTLDDMIDSCYQQECEEIKEKIKVKRKEIFKLNEKINSIREDIKNLEV